MNGAGAKSKPKNEANTDSSKLQDTNAKMAPKIRISDVNINIEADQQQATLPTKVTSSQAAAGSTSGHVSANWSLINSTQQSIARGQAKPPKRTFWSAFTAWLRPRERGKTSTLIAANALICPMSNCESTFGTYRELKGHLNYLHLDEIVPLPFIRQLKFTLNQRSIRKIVKFVNVILLVEILWFAGRNKCVVRVGGIGDSEQLSKRLQFRVGHCNKWQRVALYPFNKTIDKGFKVKTQGERLLTIHFANT